MYVWTHKRVLWFYFAKLNESVGQNWHDIFHKVVGGLIPGWYWLDHSWKMIWMILSCAFWLRHTGKFHVSDEDAKIARYLGQRYFLTLLLADNFRKAVSLLFDNSLSYAQIKIFNVTANDDWIRGKWNFGEKWQHCRRGSAEVSTRKLLLSDQPI